VRPENIIVHVGDVSVGQKSSDFGGGGRVVSPAHHPSEAIVTAGSASRFRFEFHWSDADSERSPSGPNIREERGESARGEVD
jgi:hypothetical protein